MSRITNKFSTLKKQGRKAFIPYVMAGDPSLEETKRLVLLFEECGADIVELGVPFSDPLADGPVIQRAAERAIANGVHLKDVILLVKEIRAKTQIPIVLMTYYNPVFKYGLEGFVADAVEAGVDGLIVPDLPPEEAGELIKISKKGGLDIIFLLAPTSTPERVKIVAKASRGFIYYVSITGITGAGLGGLEGIGTQTAFIRQLSGKPVAVGFGIKSPEDARAVSTLAEGVIVGSEIVRRLGKAGAGDPALRGFLMELREAIG